MIKDKSHPVWDLYDDYRTVIYYIKAYSRKIRYLRRVDMGVKIILAVLTPSSALGSFLLDLSLQWVWRTLLTLASLLAIVHPFLNLQKKIENLEKDRATYRQWFGELDRLCKQIRQRQKYDDEIKDEYIEVGTRYGNQLNDRKVLSLSRKEKKKIQDSVRERYPHESFYVPS